MKISIAVLLLVSLHLVCGRYVTSFADPLGNYVWWASLEHLPERGSNENNLVSAVFGRGTLASFPPFVSVSYIEGQKTVSSAGNTFDGSVAGLMWAYHTLAEYCEVNGQDGYQAGADAILSYQTWNQATWNQVTYGVASDYYWASLTDASSLFNLTCRLGNNSRVDGGVTVGPATVKCDVTVNATNWFAQSSTCADNKRYVALLAYIAAAEIDVKAGQDVNSNSEQASINVGGASSFLQWKTSFENLATGDSHAINAQVTDVTEDLVGRPTQLQAVKQVIFSFLSPKTETSVYYWDPQIGVDQPSSASVLYVSYLVFALIAFFAL